MVGTRRSDLEQLAFSPDSGKVDLIVTFSHYKIQGIRRRGNKGDVLRAGNLVPLVLKSPASIFRGIRYDTDEHRSCNSPGWLCYCGVPPLDYDRSGNEENAPGKRVFLVFVNDDKIIYNWHWEDADLAAWDSGLRVPVNYTQRFEEKVK